MSQPRRKSGIRWFRWLIFLTVVGALFGGAALIGIFTYYGNDPELPKLDRASDWKPKVVTKVMSIDGELVGEIFEERRTVMPREKISQHMINAIVDAEDADYYKHSGLSYWGMARAMWHNLKPGAHKQGASTLTQQLVRNLILQTRERTLKRKVQEIILAYRLDKALSKDDILTLYLNLIEFGHSRFGVEEAARFYFGKSISEVDPGEAALLASLPKGPTDIDPWKKPDRAKERQRYVLSQMVRYGHLDAKEAEKFANAPIAVVRTPAPFLGVAPEVTDEVKKQLLEKHGKKLFTMGLSVTTTIDAKLQKLARESLEKGLIDLDGRQGFRKPIAKLSTPQKIAAHEAKLKKEFPPEGPGFGHVADGVIKEVVKTPKGDGDGYKVAMGAYEGWLPAPADRNDRYNPQKLPVDKRFAVGDVVRVRKIDAPEGKPPIVALELGPQSSVVVIDPHTRAVKAVVGGYGFRPGSLNRAISGKPCRPGETIAGCRQPGSSFKPFVYAAALATGKFTPATVLNDAPQILEQPGLEPWKPSNADASEFAGSMRLRVGLAHSKNTIAAQLVDVGRGGVEPQSVANLARDCGIESELMATPAMALGASEVSVFELVNAYATLAAGGKKMDPVLIKKIGNQEIADDEPPSVQALKPEVAFLITSMLTSVIEEGTAAAARGRLKRPTAGKTGTVVYRKEGKQVHTDAWFVGFTPDLVAGVWVGFDDKHELGRGEQGGKAALPIWIEIMSAALKNVPPKAFTQPPGIVVQKIDPKTGLLAPPGATGMDEYFLDGTAPTEVAPQAGEANPDTYIIDQAQ